MWSLPSLWHAHHPNVVGGASLQCSQDGGCTTDSPHLQGPFWWGVRLPWLSGVLDSVVYGSPSKSLPHYCQSWGSVLHTRSGTDTHHVRITILATGTYTCKNTKQQSRSTASKACTEQSIISYTQLFNYLVKPCLFFKVTTFMCIWKMGRHFEELGMMQHLNTNVCTLCMGKNAVTVGLLVLCSYVKVCYSSLV